MKKLNRKWDIVVLSPHLDDAVLSLGSHIIKWKKEGKKIKVITVFNRFGNRKNLPSYTKDYLQKSGFDTVVRFENARNREDQDAMKMLGVEYEHWDFIDAGFRGVYKTREALLSGTINNKDNELVKQIEIKIKTLSSELFLVPYGVGGHVDHLIVKKAAEKMETRGHYLEQPYLWQNFNYLRLFKEILKLKNIMKRGRVKDKILRSYKSQYSLWSRGYLNYLEIVVNI